VSDLPSGIPQLACEIGHKSMSVTVYSHPSFGVAGSLSWGVWKGSQSVRTFPQVKYSRDAAIASWQDAVSLLRHMIDAAERQLAILDVSDE
jgi:hypothetical protein